MMNSSVYKVRLFDIPSYPQGGQYVLLEMGFSLTAVILNIIVLATIKNAERLLFDWRNAYLANLCAANIMLGTLTKLTLSVVVCGYAVERKDVAVNFSFCTLWVFTRRTFTLVYPLTILALCWTSFRERIDEIRQARKMIEIDEEALEIEVAENEAVLTKRHMIRTTSEWNTLDEYADRDGSQALRRKLFAESKNDLFNKTLDSSDERLDSGNAAAMGSRRCGSCDDLHPSLVMCPKDNPDMQKKLSRSERSEKLRKGRSKLVSFEDTFPDVLSENVDMNASKQLVVSLDRLTTSSYTDIATLPSYSSLAKTTCPLKKAMEKSVSNLSEHSQVSTRTSQLSEEPRIKKLDLANISAIWGTAAFYGLLDEQITGKGQMCLVSDNIHSRLYQGSIIISLFLPFVLGPLFATIAHLGVFLYEQSRPDVKRVLREISNEKEKSFFFLVPLVVLHLFCFVVNQGTDFFHPEYISVYQLILLKHIAGMVYLPFTPLIIFFCQRELRSSVVKVFKENPASRELTEQQKIQEIVEEMSKK